MSDERGITLPSIPHTLAVFGEGRASQTLNRIEWLGQVRLFYWGDMDPYGYNILSALRSDFSGVQSILMNRDAFTRYPAYQHRRGRRRTAHRVIAVPIWCSVSGIRNSPRPI